MVAWPLCAQHGPPADPRPEVADSPVVQRDSSRTPPTTRTPSGSATANLAVCPEPPGGHLPALASATVVLVTYRVARDVVQPRPGTAEYSSLSA